MATAWITHVKKTAKANPGMPLKQVLKKASASYKWGKMPEPVKFLDLKTKMSFVSRDYTTEINSKNMLIARTTSPSGTQTTRLLKRAWKNKITLFLNLVVGT